MANFFSNLFGGGNQQMVSPVTSNYNYQMGDKAYNVSGGSTSNQPIRVSPIQPKQPSTGSTGSVLGKTTNVPSSGSSTAQRSLSSQQDGSNPFDSLLSQVQNSGPSQEEIDSAFNPILDVYNQAESNLRGQLPGLISEAEQQAELSRRMLGDQRAGANEQLAGQEQQTEQQRMRGIGQQRQTLQELTQANQARFGGASSAGLAASELQGREFQRGTAGINQQAQQAVTQIMQQKNQVERDYNMGLQQVQANTQKAINDINRRFQDKLLEINSRRGETEAAKAQARMNAAQELRNAAFQINVQRAQFEADLKAQAQQNSTYLDSVASNYTQYLDQGQGAVDQANQYVPTAIPGVEGGQQQGPTEGLQLAGMIGPQSNNRDRFFGQIFGGPAQNIRGIPNGIFNRQGEQTGSSQGYVTA